MKNRPLLLALAANLLFWSLLFIMAALRPDYSHLHKAVSELGSYGAPRMWLWNVMGYLLPGLLLGAAGWGIGKKMRPGWLLPGLLAAAGVMVAWAGIFPADMSDRHGLATRLHLVSSFASLILWLLALVVLAFHLRGRWRNAALVALGCFAALAVAILTSNPATPGLTQRLMFAIFFFSYPALALVRPRAD